MSDKWLMMIGAISLNGFGKGTDSKAAENSGFVTNGKALFRCRGRNSESITNGKGTIQMPWKKLRVHHEREEHYSDAVEKTQSPSRTGRALFRYRGKNSESITNGKGTSSTRAVCVQNEPAL
jgi:hypothetical protein